MSRSRCEIKAVINPCFYGISLPLSNLQSLVGIYGIVPVKPKTFPDVSSYNLLLVLNKWLKFNYLIKELMSLSEEVEFRQECLVDGIPFGNFILTTSEGNISLKSYLLLNNICTVSRNPDADSFFIKSKSLKPTDFNLSSLSPSVKAERKLRTRLQKLEKPRPLPKTNRIKKNKENVLSHEDSAIVSAILANIPDTPNFIERYSRATSFQNRYSSTVESQPNTEKKVVDTLDPEKEAVNCEQSSKENCKSNTNDIYPAITSIDENSTKSSVEKQILSEKGKVDILCLSSTNRKIQPVQSIEKVSLQGKQIQTPKKLFDPKELSVSESVMEKEPTDSKLISAADKNNLGSPTSNRIDKIHDGAEQSKDVLSFSEHLKAAQSRLIKNELRGFVKVADSLVQDNSTQSASRNQNDDLETQMSERRQQRRNAFLKSVQVQGNGYSQTLSSTVIKGKVEDGFNFQGKIDDHSTSLSFIQSEHNDSEHDHSVSSCSEEVDCNVSNPITLDIISSNTNEAGNSSSAPSENDETFNYHPSSSKSSSLLSTREEKDLTSSMSINNFNNIGEREEKFDSKFDYDLTSSNKNVEYSEPDENCKSDPNLNRRNGYTDVHSHEADSCFNNTDVGDESFKQSEKMRTSLSSLLEESAASNADVSSDEIVGFPTTPRKNKTDSDIESSASRDRLKLYEENSVTSLSDVDASYTRIAELPSDYTLDEYLDKIVSFEGLVHGREALPPINWFSDSTLHSLVIAGLVNHNIKDLLRSQSFAIPNILNRRNVTIIGLPRSGKTLAAVIPLIGLLCEQQFYDSLKKGSGAKAVFITSCAQRVNNVAETIRKITSHLKVVSTHGGGCEIEKLDDLVNGCDILVSTPRCWLRLLKYKWITRVNRLCHVVVDDMNLMTDLYKPELLEIVKLFKSIKKKRGEEGPEPQLVLVGESWTPILSDIVIRSIPEPLVCFTSLMEAAFYANIKPKFHVLSPSNKAVKLLELLRSRDVVPTIIICNISEEVCLLRNLLYTTRAEVLVAHGDMLFMMKKDIHLQWQNSIIKDIPPLLITCDDALVDLGINNASWLIHYSISATKTSFDYRFSTIKSLFSDRLSKTEVATHPLASVDIIIDHSVEHQLPDITALMHRFKAPIPDELLTAVEKITKKKEKNKSSAVGFCKNLFQFGHCWKKNRCKQQHCLDYNRDKSKDLPLSGFLGVKVLKVHSPIHFSVRLISHNDTDTTSPESWTPIPSTYMKAVLHINRYYSVKSNRRMHGTVKVGDLAGVEVEFDTVFARVKILQIIQRDAQHNASSVLVHFIDEGPTSVIKAIKLLHLPEELTSYPQSCVDLYLTHLQPVDLDRDWSIAPTKKVLKKLNSISENYTLVAKITLVLGYKMLIESFKAVETLDVSKCSVVHMDLRNFLIDENIAVHNPEHLVPLLELCAEVKIPTPALAPPKDKKSKCCNEVAANMREGGTGSKTSNKIKWAHLSKDEVSTVILKNADSPSLLYVAHEKFDSLLGQLEKDICKHVERRNRPIVRSQLESNIFCLAKFEDKWNRAMFQSDVQPVTDEHGVLLYPVQFVDYGDTEYLPLTDIRHCPEQFLHRLPFQAINCELAGIKPLHEEWPDDIVDILYGSTKIPDDDGSYIFKSLSLIVVEVNDAENMSKPGKHYNVIIFYKTNGMEIILNEELVTQGYASWVPEGKEVIDSVVGSYTSQANHKISPIGDPEDCKNNKMTPDSVKNEDSGYDDEKNMSEGQLIQMLENFDIQLPSNTADNSFLNFFSNLKQKVLSKAGKITDDGTVKPSDVATNADNAVSIESKPNDCINGIIKKDSDGNRTLSEYQFKSGYYTPKAAWYQTHSLVVVRIMMPGIEKYSLSWSMLYFDFSTTYDGRRYRLIVDLFGPIVIDSCQHFCRGQYVEIKMPKVMAGYEWPQLLYDERDKPMWLEILDVPCEEEDDMNIRLSLAEMKSKQFKFEPIKVEGKVWHYDPEDDDESDSSEVLQDTNYDPYDPLD